jgi:hypothetical protein
MTQCGRRIHAASGEGGATLPPMRRWIAAVSVVATLAVAPSASAASGSSRACEPVRNPYPDTRYEGEDLTRIRALETSCRTARRVARRAHYKALRIPPSRGAVRRFSWRGWRVRGDLRGDHDRYIARKGERRVRWRF